jgi:hypothetical protein
MDEAKLERKPFELSVTGFPAVTGSLVESEKWRALAVKVGDLCIEVRTSQSIPTSYLAFCSAGLDGAKLKLWWSPDLIVPSSSSALPGFRASTEA